MLIAMSSTPSIHHAPIRPRDRVGVVPVVELPDHRKILGQITGERAVVEDMPGQASR